MKLLLKRGLIMLVCFVPSAFAGDRAVVLECTFEKPDGPPRKKMMDIDFEAKEVIFEQIRYKENPVEEGGTKFGISEMSNNAVAFYRQDRSDPRFTWFYRVDRATGRIRYEERNGNISMGSCTKRVSGGF